MPFGILAQNKEIKKDSKAVSDSINSAESTVTNKTETEPLYILNGKIIGKEEFKKINPNDIEFVNVLKSKSATKKYGEDAKNGVVEIFLKAK